MKRIIKKVPFWTLISLITATVGLAQQVPQFTQYMYNTVSVNPAYAGQRGGLSIVGLNRVQWVGIDGAPTTQTLSVHTPLKNERIGLGLSLINDKIGPLHEIHVQSQFSYTVPLNDRGTKLSFGINAGLHNKGSDFGKGKVKNPDPSLDNDFNDWSPILGTGAYLHSSNWYLGLATPNLLLSDNKEIKESPTLDRVHFIGIGGLVLDTVHELKIKPAFLIKAVSGAPIIADVSLNFLYDEKLTLGASWRWDDAFIVLAGFQISKSFYAGYAYDMTTTTVNDFSSGTHEILLRLEIPRPKKILSPRFF